MTDRAPTHGDRLLGSWESLPAGELRWVAEVGLADADAWLSRQLAAVTTAAELAGRLEGRMLAAVAQSHDRPDSPASRMLAAVAQSHDRPDSSADRILAAVAQSHDLPDSSASRMLAAVAQSHDRPDSPAGRALAALGPSHDRSDSPEADLRAEFDAARAFLEGRAATLLAAVSGALTGLWQRARLDASDVFDQLGLLLEGGTIETRSAALRPVARTMVDWSGDIQTAWTPGLRPWEIALHRENVAVALRAREAALDGVAAAARGAARLTALIAAPASTAAVMTLPIAWRYLRRLWNMSA